MTKDRNATRPLEYVAFLCVEVRTKQGPAFIYLAVDQYLDYVFNLGAEQSKSPEVILSKIYFLVEDADFAQYLGNGFTLVLEEFHDLSRSIENIIAPAGGKVLFDKPFHNVITNPVLMSLLKTMREGL